MPSALLAPFEDLLSSPPARLGIPVCVIGGGGTGAALAYDLTLRGFSVLLLEKGELTSGTTGRHHGQLHCGARYALADKAVARECMEESRILRAMVPEAIEYNGGVFVALKEEDEALTPRFVEACAEAGIPAREVEAREALELEPALSPAIRRAVLVPDGSFDAFRLPLSFFAAARALGARIMPWSEVLALERKGGRIAEAIVLDRTASPPRELRIRADYFINAAGAWAGRVGALAGLDVPVSPARGTMFAVRARLVDRVVSHLHPAGDGDILVPQRGLTIIGSTQRLAEDPDQIPPPPEDIPFLAGLAAAMLPSFSAAPFHAAWSAARPLAGRLRAGRPIAGLPLAGGQAAATSPEDGRSISRDFAALSHAEREGAPGMCTIIGGKATVLRAMAEKTADLVCRELGIGAACRTKDFALPSWRSFYGGPRR